MQEAGVAFEFWLTGPGWARGRLTIGERWAEAIASYLADALGDFLRAVRELTAGAPGSEALWEDEPGEFRWVFTQEGPMVRVQLLVFPRRTVLDAECRLRDLVHAVVLGAGRALAEYGWEGYRKKWIEHDFPLDNLRALEDWLEQT